MRRPRNRTLLWSYFGRIQSTQLASRLLFLTEQILFGNYDSSFYIPKCVDCGENLSKDALKAILPVYSEYIESNYDIVESNQGISIYDNEAVFNRIRVVF